MGGLFSSCKCHKKTDVIPDRRNQNPYQNSIDLTLQYNDESYYSERAKTNTSANLETRCRTFQAVGVTRTDTTTLGRTFQYAGNRTSYNEGTVENVSANVVPLGIPSQEADKSLEIIKAKIAAHNKQISQEIGNRLSYNKGTVENARPKVEPLGKTSQEIGNRPSTNKGTVENVRPKVAPLGKTPQEIGNRPSTNKGTVENVRPKVAPLGKTPQEIGNRSSNNKGTVENVRPKVTPLGKTPQELGKRNRLVHLIDPTEIVSEELVPLPVSEQRFVRDLIGDFQVDFEEFYEVKNSFLKGMYKLKKAEYKSRFNSPPKEKWLIHATARVNVKNIIKNNFDWRKVIRTRYGAGTSFTNDADYANYYCNNRKGIIRALIICKVLIFNACEGKENEIPTNNYDTSLGRRNYDGVQIYVKFNDNEFLPVYVVYYKSSKKLILRSPYYRNYER